MKFLRYGDSALLINFDQKIDEQINKQVIALHRALEISGIQGITFLIPAYCSLTVGFNPTLINFETLKTTIVSFAKEEIDHNAATKDKTIKIPVCYDPPFSLDFEEVMSHTQLCKESIISIHTSTTFRVYMLGFVAGFAYMGTLPELLRCPRKSVPRKQVPMGSVGLAGLQTGIYPTNAPGGWQVIGQTPLMMFDPEKPNPSLLQPGNLVRFESISQDEFEQIKRLQSVGEYKLEVIDD